MARQSNSKKSLRWLRPSPPPLAGPMSLRVVCVSSATAHGRTDGRIARSLALALLSPRSRRRTARGAAASLSRFARRRASTQLAPGPVSSERRAGLVLFDKGESDDNRRRRDKDWSDLRRSKASDKRFECQSVTERRRSKVPRSGPTYSVFPIPGSERLSAV